jgi:dolichol-phosphate mannosyltransferase
MKKRLTNKKKNILVGIVVYNEEEKIKKVLDNIQKLPKTSVYTFLFLDDHSTDNSTTLLQKFVKKHPKAFLKRNTKNSGVGKSIKSIIAFGIKNKFDICVIMAGNGKDNPAEINNLLLPIIEHDHDYVQGSRFLNGGSFQNLPFARKNMIRGFTFMVYLATGYYGTDASNGFRAYKLSLFKNKRINMNQEWLDRYEFETYLHYKVITLGYKICEVPVSKNYLKNVKSYSKIKPLVDWWKMIRPLIYLKLRIKN